MPEIFASLGSNQQPENNIISAVAAIRRRFGPLTCSTVYQNKAVGFEGDDFLNMVLSLQTGIEPREVREIFRQIEADHGRTRQEKKFASRTLDIDLILYGGRVIDEGQLKLPHENILEYAFVLRPLSEIAPGLLHPSRRQSYRQIWREYQRHHELHPVNLILPDAD